MNYLTEFDGKPFQSVSKVDESLENWLTKLMRRRERSEKALNSFIDRVKALLGERVKDVRLTLPSDRYASDRFSTDATKNE